MDYLKGFSDVVYKTMAARFTAYRRMKRNRNASKVAESFFSASIIAISLIALQNHEERLSDLISIVTIILSTFLLVMSLLFSGLDYEKRMDNYHDCGNELDKLYRDMKLILSYGEEFSSDEMKAKTEDFQAKYFDILHKYNLNHTSFDYEYTAVMLDEQKDFVSRLVMKFRYYVWDMYFLYWVIALLPVVLIGWYLCRLLLVKI